MTTLATYTPSSLIAGDFPQVKDTGVIAAGQVLKRGAVLGQITADGQYKLSATAASDGSQTPKVILDEDIDTTGGAHPGPLLLTGEVRGAALQLGAGHTIASVKAALRTLSLFVR
ncbi:head decoration protein [Aquipseudomonas alcaligenes]|uniref:Bacteriophage lambda head decoration protein D n=1 Tax=Aquipseudomonas alcaligenes TaxID=43263 RepID=A0A1N6S8D4_AQUAC|nr:head decoration protein [Pseudomonas alcaligenes]SIQ37216.1 Bacteriophage lambda head decoration protein D [Pseudomonas alcaligenes]